MSLTILSLFALATCGSAAFNFHQHRVALEEGQAVGIREGWKMKGAANNSSTASLVFAIKLQNRERLEQVFWNVSTPGSSQYGAHWTLGEIDALVHPKTESLVALKEWLTAHNIDDNECDKLKGNGFWTCHVPVSVAAPLLHTSFEEVEETATGRKMVRATRQHYTVPVSVAEHLDFVGGVHRFPGTRVQKTKSEPSLLGVTPLTLRTLYKVGDTVGSAANNSQAVAQFLGEYFHQYDLEEFWSQFGHFPHKEQVDKYLGPDLGEDGVEAALDVEYIMSLGANITTWFWSTGGEHEGQERFLSWIAGVGNTSTVPFVHSVSYGDVESSVDIDYMDRVNDEFKKMGARGLSILFASGDSGAGCQDRKFAPSFPATSPYITAVGGTVVGSAGTSESANSISGGGFSNVFGRPSYQVDAVEHFLSTSSKLPNKQYFNGTSRGYPDVSAASADFIVICNKQSIPGVAGTSCAAPTFSGVVALVNDYKFLNGFPSLGFLNPLLYKQATVVTDITTGCNEGCQGDGFCAEAGWDPVTGLGTPNFEAMKQL